MVRINQRGISFATVQDQQSRLWSQVQHVIKRAIKRPKNPSRVNVTGKTGDNVKAQKALFVTVTVIVFVLAISNFENLGQQSSLALPFLGSYVMPTRFLGLLSIIVVALAFYLSAGFNATHATARRATDLERIDGLRTALDNREANRVEALHASLKNHSALLARLESRNLLAQGETENDLRQGIFNAPEDEHPFTDSFDKSQNVLNAKSNTPL
jgi:hypothetical protein